MLSACRTQLNGREKRPAPASRMSENLLSRAKVLIVDDEASNIRLLERILEMFGGAKTRSTTDSREALRIYSEFQPDLILLDLHMPHLDGFAIIEQIKNAVPSAEYLPILVLTADVTLATKRRALTSGAKDILTKPLDHFEVVLRMKNLIENRFLHQELQRQNAHLERQVKDRVTNVEVDAANEDLSGCERLSALKRLSSGLVGELTGAVTTTLGNAELLLPYVEAHAPARELGYLHSVLAAAQDTMRAVVRIGEFCQASAQHDLRLPLNSNDTMEEVIDVASPHAECGDASSEVRIKVISD